MLLRSLDLDCEMNNDKYNLWASQQVCYWQDKVEVMIGGFYIKNIEVVESIINKIFQGPLYQIVPIILSTTYYVIKCVIFGYQYSKQMLSNIMIDENPHLKLTEIEDNDTKLHQLFSAVLGILPPLEEKTQQNKCHKPKNNDNYSDIDFKDEVYSERPINKRNRIRKVQNKIWKNLKKTRSDTYIRMLENKVQNLQKEISKQKAINKSNQDYIKKLSLSQQIISGVFVGKSQIYDRLQTLTQQSDTQQTRKQIVKQITTLRYRLGVIGKDRIKAINHYFKQMVESFIPQCQRFLIYTACKGIDFFSEEYLQNGFTKYSRDQFWREEIMGSVSLSYEQRKTIYSFKPIIIEQKFKYDNLVNQFSQIRKQLTQQAKRLQNVFDGFRAFLTPYQLSRILVNIQKNKYRKEMGLQGVDKFWSYELDKKDSAGCAQSLFASTATENWN